MNAISGQMNLAQMNASSVAREKALENALNPRDVAEIKKAAKEFESIFMNMMLESMRKTVPTDGLMGGGNAEDIYRSMLDSEYAKVLAEHQSSGLADTISRQLLESMGKQSGIQPKLEGHQAYQKHMTTGALQEDAKQGTIGSKTP
jgi:flagellar protein FlgJ